MALYLPQRLIVKPQSKYSEQTKEIIRRTHSYDDSIPIEYLPSPEFKYPVKDPRDKFLFMKGSAIISERSESFIRTFDSPGNIVESITTVLNLAWMCPYQCEYCYLQTNQTPEHYLYTNLKEAEREIASAQVAHTAILTLWTHLSYYFGQQLNKLPDRFKETSDWIREEFVKGRITTDREAIDRYYLMQHECVQWLNRNNKTFQIDGKKFRADRERIKGWYQANKQFPLILTSSEFCDLLGVDHLTGNSNFLMRMVEKYPSIQYTVRTKSANVDEILQYDGDNRVKIHISLNTDEMIRQYEHGTATLDERIEAALKVQKSTGFKLSIVMEPMILHEGYIKNYSTLVRRVFKELDPAKIHFFTFGSVRYSAQLQAMIKMHFPRTTLFNRAQQLAAPIQPDTKYRYPVKLRSELYGKLVALVQEKKNIKVKLGAEEEIIWKALGMDKGIELGGRVFESIGKEGTTLKPANSSEKKEKHNGKKQPPKPNPKPAKIKPLPKNIPPPNLEGVEEEDYEPAWHSIASQKIDIIEVVLERLDEGIPLEELHSGIEKLEQMSVIKSDDEGNQWIVDQWDVEEATSIQAVIQSNGAFRPVKIVGNITSISKTLPFDLEEYTRAFISIGITDSKGTKIETHLIDISHIAVDIDILKSYKGKVTFYGMIVPYYSGNQRSKNDREFRFYLHDFTLSAKDMDVLKWVPAEEFDGTFRYNDGKGKVYGIPVNHPSVIIRNNPGPNGIIKYIKNELTKNLKIVALQDAKELDRALEFVILQSLSQGYGEFLQKLHMLVIGPPTAGKSYLTKSAVSLNTVGQEITSSKMKISAAGLIGTVKQKSGGNISVPGILPNNSGGVVCIQEFHEIVGEKRKEVCGIFLRMMEEGKVIDSTSGNTSHHAETALLIDQNRYSDLYPNKEFDSFSDFDIPVPVLARFDHIMLMPQDGNRAKMVADEMIDTFKSLDKKRLAQTNWSNDLKYLIAYLKSEFGNVTFPDDVREYIKERFNEAINKLPNVKELEKLIDNMRARMMRSVIKISKAVAAANATRTVTKDHVDYAMIFVQDKLNFLKSIHAQDVVSAKPPINDVGARQDLLAKKFYGEQFTTKDAHSYILENMEGSIDDKTIRRDLKEIGATAVNAKGLYAIKANTSKKKL